MIRIECQVTQAQALFCITPIWPLSSRLAEQATHNCLVLCSTHRGATNFTLNLRRAFGLRSQGVLTNRPTSLKASKGRIMSLNYTKLNGSHRRLIGRTGVKSYLKGGVNNVERLDRPYLTMFDMMLKEYRTVKLDTLLTLRLNGVNYQVVD